MSEQIIFKSQAFGGFNKEEVLKYIDSLNAKHSEEQEQTEKELLQTKEELSEERSKRKESEDAFKEVMEAYEELRKHYIMLKERSDNLESENTGLKSRCEKAESELKDEKSLNIRLAEQLDSEIKKAEQEKNEKRKILDSVSEMGNTAKAMLSGAKNSAQSMINDAQISVDGINSEIDTFCDELEKTKSFMQDSLSVLSQRLEYIRNAAVSAKFSGEKQSEKYSDIQNNYEKVVSEVEMKISNLKNHFFH